MAHPWPCIGWRKKGKKVSRESYSTRVLAHLKIKKLSTNLSRDFNSVLDTNNHYQIDPAKYFCPNTSSTSAICDSYKSNAFKMVKSKNARNFY